MYQNEILQETCVGYSVTTEYMSKIDDFSGRMFCHTQYKYLSEALETFYHH